MKPGIELEEETNEERNERWDREYKDLFERIAKEIVDEAVRLLSKEKK